MVDLEATNRRVGGKPTNALLLYLFLTLDYSMWAINIKKGENRWFKDYLVAGSSPVWPT